MTTNDSGVPRYFADFVQENARQHQELSERIGAVQAELGTRIGRVEGKLFIIQALAVGIFIAVGASAIKYLFGL